MHFSLQPIKILPKTSAKAVAKPEKVPKKPAKVDMRKRRKKEEGFLC